MGISSALQRWEEWQLRILALSSLVVQYILLIMSPRRKIPMKFYLRYFIWLAYLSSDALAIYALATLFNRHRKKDDGYTHRTGAS
ncbi:Os07g0269600 [Oryza sativa Japonica Group]|uniref:Os07g0269600 protein n=1 Tax=Oryza sativa subsp. japonica TaxID=39947 RepID=A0A0P0X514_ORYSJ|nr:Os07g0269600 [Oryza sativa Japonica Group]